MGLPKFVGLENRLRSRFITFRMSILNPKSTNQVLVCAPALPGSLGDQAMVQAAVTSLVGRGFAVDLLVEGQDEDWSGVEGLRNKLAIKIDKTADVEPALRALYNYHEFYVIGADVLDGYHNEPTTIRLLWLTWLASLVCKKVTIVGFSLNDNPTTNSILMLRRLPSSIRLFARDSISQERLQRFANIKADLSADIAFLLDPYLHKEASKKYTNWVHEQKRQKRNVIGFNISAHSYAKVVESATGRQEVLEHYKNELETILQKKIAILLVPHDIRGENGDLQMLRDLFLLITPDLATRVQVMEPPIYASTVKSVVGSLDAVVSGRMHLAIACLGMSTPVGCVVYQGKFEGLYKHFPGIKLTALSPDEALQPGTIVSLVEMLLSEETKLRTYLRRRLPYIRKMAQKNISN